MAAVSLRMRYCTETEKGLERDKVIYGVMRLRLLHLYNLGGQIWYLGRLQTFEESVQGTILDVGIKGFANARKN